MIIGNYNFIHPQFLLLLGLIPIIAFWYYSRYKDYYPTLRMSSLEGLTNTVSYKTILQLMLPFLRALAFILLVIAMARPQEMLKEEDIKAEGIDIMLVMDLSSSMLARDFTPDRLEVSKTVASQFVDKRPYDRIGLAVFSGEAFTQCPLTTDHRVVKEFLSNLRCGILEDGTAIGMGLATGVNRLKDTESVSKVVILLTDGVNNSGYIKPMTAAQIAMQYNIKVYTIGIGSVGEAVTPVSVSGDGRYVFGLARVEIDEELLQEIAEMTGGAYFRATSKEGLEEIYSKIDELEKTEIEVTTVRRYTEEFHRFAFVGLLLLILEMVLKYAVVRALP